MWTLFITAYLNRRKYAAVSNNNATKRYNNQIVNLRFLRGPIGEILWEKCDKISKNTNISLITDTISNDIDTSKKPICKVPIRYRYIDIGDISNICTIYRPVSVVDKSTTTEKCVVDERKPQPRRLYSISSTNSDCRIFENEFPD